MHINQHHSTHNKTRAYNSAALSISSFLWCLFHKSIFFCLFLSWSQLGLDPIPATIGRDAGPTQKDRKPHSHLYPCKILTRQLTQTPSVRVSGLWDEAFLHNQTTYTPLQEYVSTSQPMCVSGVLSRICDGFFLVNSPCLK